MKPIQFLVKGIHIQAVYEDHLRLAFVFYSDWPFRQLFFGQYSQPRLNDKIKYCILLLQWFVKLSQSRLCFTFIAFYLNAIVIYKLGLLNNCFCLFNLKFK